MTTEQLQEQQKQALVDRISQRLSSNLYSESESANKIVKHCVQCARNAIQGGNGMSTSEGLIAGLLLNRQDLLQQENYTIVEALERIGSDYVAALPTAMRILKNAGLA